MPDMPSITIVKSFEYRTVQEEFSNRYHFSGTVPANDADWLTLASAIIAAEKLTVHSNVHFYRAYGYEAGNVHSVFQHDYKALALDVAGTFGGTAGQEAPGDVAATIRWLSAGLSARHKKVYLRKYMHGVYTNGSGDQDKLLPAQRTVLATFAAKLIDGTLPGGFTYCGPQGHAASAPIVDQWLTTRTLKRRGKRHPT